MKERMLRINQGHLFSGFPCCEVQSITAGFLVSDGECVVQEFQIIDKNPLHVLLEQGFQLNSNISVFQSSLPVSTSPQPLGNPSVPFGGIFDVLVDNRAHMRRGNSFCR